PSEGVVERVLTCAPRRDRAAPRRLWKLLERVAFRGLRLERVDDTLERFAPAAHRHRPRGLRSADEPEPDRIPASNRDPRHRPPDQRRPRALRPRPGAPAVPNRRGRVDDEPKRAIGLRLELPNEQVVVTQERAHVEPTQIVARHVRAMPAELDAGTFARAPM